MRRTTSSLVSVGRIIVDEQHFPAATGKDVRQLLEFSCSTLAASLSVGTTTATSSGGCQPTRSGRQGRFRGACRVKMPRFDRAVPPCWSSKTLAN